eukprot:2892927-Pyramimonas_sp.AAC.1
MQDSLSEGSPATILLAKCFKCRPDVLGFAGFAYRDKKIASGLVAPLQEHPIVNGLSWVKQRPLDNERLESVAKKLGKGAGELRGEISDLHTQGAMSGDVHRVLM